MSRATESGLAVFKLLAELAPEHLYRYGMDWICQSQSGADSLEHWEEREPGSLRAIMNSLRLYCPYNRK